MGWRLGRIDPRLDAEADGGGSLRVVVLLRRPGAAGPEGLAEVRESHRSVLRELSGRVREIELRARRGEGSLTEAEERDLAPLLDGRIPPSDRALRRDLREKIDARLHSLRTDVGARLRLRTAPIQAGVEAAIEAAGGLVHSRVHAVNALGAAIPSFFLDDLARHPDVRVILKDRTAAPALDLSVPATGYDDWHAAGFDGGVWDGGLIDTGVRMNHPAMTHLIFYTDEATATITDDHGTHVAGIMASSDATYLGTAPAMESLFWSLLGGGLPNSMNRMETLATSFPDSPEVMNFSAAFDVADTFDYDDAGAFFDTYVQNYSMLATIAAGNAGWADTEPSLGSPAHAYNVLAIANMDDLGTADRSMHVRSSSSSVGPTLAGRRKPDLAAPGTNIMSANSFWDAPPPGPVACGNGSTADFINCSGTSMAAPHAAGAVVVMEDGGNHDPMAQRAVLINTADWWDSNDTQTTSDDGPVTAPGPAGDSQWDKSYGWGYLDMTEALFNRADYFLSSVIARNDTAVEDDYKLYKGRMLAGERATLAWEKRGVYIGNSVPTTTYPLTDLNLRLYDEDGGSLVDWDFDTNDNVHQVKVPVDTNVVIKVYAFSSSISGAAAEPFALATEENFVEVMFPETFQGLASWPSNVAAGTEIDVTFWVRNDSQAASHNNQFQLVLPSGWTLLSGGNPSVVGTAAGSGGESFKMTWRVRAQTTVQSNVTLFVDHSHGSYAEISSIQRWSLPLDVVECTLAAHCNDGLFCTGIETCFSDTCQAGTPVNCDDGNPCTFDSCDNSSASCVNTPTDFPPSTAVGSGGVAPLSWQGGSATALQWGAVPDATFYEVHTGAVEVIGGLDSSATDSCVDSATTGTSVSTILDVPPPGDGLYFMVIPGNECGLGPVGPATPGPRVHDSTGSCGASCAQDKCATGTLLDPACEPCAAQVCDVDPFCCGTSWDSLCVDRVFTVCNNLSCLGDPGTCGQSLCIAGPSGTPMAPGCDSPAIAPSCVDAVCAVDPFCCTTDWDGLCVEEVSAICGLNCS